MLTDEGNTVTQMSSTPPFLATEAAAIADAEERARAARDAGDECFEREDHGGFFESHVGRRDRQAELGRSAG